MQMHIDIDVATPTGKERDHATDEIEGHLLAALHVLQDSGYDPTITITTDNTEAHILDPEGTAA